MKDHYDFSKGFKRPDLAKRLRENGYKVTVTDGDGENAKIIREYFVSPEEVTARSQRRAEFTENNRVQG
jgi:NAD/NADP transhydrogenase alpha subunit